MLFQQINVNQQVVLCLIKGQHVFIISSLMYVVNCMVHNKLTKGHIEIYVLVFYDVIQSDKLEAK